MLIRDRWNVQHLLGESGPRTTMRCNLWRECRLKAGTEGRLAMDDTLQQGDGIAGRHGTAREFAERALAAEARGDQDEADRLFAQAERLDPEAAATVLSERRREAGSTGRTAPQGMGPRQDDEVAAITRTVTGDDAPSRAGITGSGSGADGQGT
jgi:hypothetical protein